MLTNIFQVFTIINFYIYIETIECERCRKWSQCTVIHWSCIKPLLESCVLANNTSSTVSWNKFSLSYLPFITLHRNEFSSNFNFQHNFKRHASFIYSMFLIPRPPQYFGFVISPHFTAWICLWFSLSSQMKDLCNFCQKLWYEV